MGLALRHRNKQFFCWSPACITGILACMHVSRCVLQSRAIQVVCAMCHGVVCAMVFEYGHTYCNTSTGMACYRYRYHKSQIAILNYLVDV